MSQSLNMIALMLACFLLYLSTHWNGLNLSSEQIWLLNPWYSYRDDALLSVISWVHARSWVLQRVCCWLAVAEQTYLSLIIFREIGPLGFGCSGAYLLVLASAFDTLASQLLTQRSGCNFYLFLTVEDSTVYLYSKEMWIHHYAAISPFCSMNTQVYQIFPLA